MPQITQGIRSILSLPIIYSSFKKLIGTTSASKVFVEDYIQPKTGDRILDIGCGLGDIVAYLPDVNYTGFDISAEYINAAKQKFGHRATFICQEISEDTLEQKYYYDIVLASGIIHHLDDNQALQLFKLAETALKQGGRLITCDGVFIKNQSPFARFIISKDRGQNIRSEEEYVQLAAQVFSKISVHIRHDLLRIPYTHIMLECTR